MTQQNTIQNTGDLLDFLAAVSLAHKIAENHASQMTPKEVVSYVQALNQEIFDKIIIG